MEDKLYESGRRLTTGIAGLRACQTPVRAHEGNYSDFLRRHIAKCNLAKTDERRNILAELMTTIRDERVLRDVMDQLDEDGPKAAGPNGWKLSELTRTGKWELARALRQLLTTGNYRRGPTKQVKIEKPHKLGQFRTLEIPNLEDQIIQKAIEQVLQPLLDPRFDDWSFGFRPGRNREHALATALHIANAGKLVWITEDLKDAFTTIPHGKLLETLCKYGIPRDVVDLIAECIRNEANRGIPQGGCLSPLLLNVYLDKHLDRKWRRPPSEAKLLRYADDLCVCCSSQAEANDAYDRLQRTLLPTGMTLKGNTEEAIRDLREDGVTAELLGYTVSRESGQIIVTISEKAWASLGANLKEAHRFPMSAVRALESMEGFVDQAGPSLRSADIEQMQQMQERITQLAATQCFEEVLTIEEILKIRENALRRFDAIMIVRETANGLINMTERTAA